MGGAYDVLARIRANRAAPQPAGERCEMCSESIAEEHQHVVNVEGRQLMCVCRACYLLFTEANAEHYRAVASERGIAELGSSEHVYRFEQALSVWRHPFWLQNARDDLEEYCAFVRERTDLRLGIEADFVAGGEEKMGTLLAARDFDYVVGSVHFLRDRAVDMDDYSVWQTARSPEAVSYTHLTLPTILLV